VVGLVDCGTRALVAIGQFRDGESRLATLLVRSIRSGMAACRAWRAQARPASAKAIAINKPEKLEAAPAIPDGQPGQLLHEDLARSHGSGAPDRP
jgi:hypothetical protein